jgi:hypothetical protein
MDNFHITKFGLLTITMLVFFGSILFGTICLFIGDKLKKREKLHNNILAIKKRFK